MTDLDPRISRHPLGEQTIAAQPNPLTGDRQLHLQLLIATKVSQKKETKTLNFGEGASIDFNY
jgi:hypothetical protein